MSVDLPLVKRFLRKTWCAERIAIDAMKTGDVLKFSAPQYANVKAAVERSNDAYGGTRVWTLTTVEHAATVRRVL